QSLFGVPLPQVFGNGLHPRPCPTARIARGPGRRVPARPRAQLFLERLAGDADPLCDAADVDVAERRIDGGADGRQQAVERATSPVDVIEVVALLEHLQLPLEDVD